MIFLISFIVDFGLAMSQVNLAEQGGELRLQVPLLTQGYIPDTQALKNEILNLGRDIGRVEAGMADFKKEVNENLRDWRNLMLGIPTLFVIVGLVVGIFRSRALEKRAESSEERLKSVSEAYLKEVLSDAVRAVKNESDKGAKAIHMVASNSIGSIEKLLEESEAMQARITGHIVQQFEPPNVIKNETLMLFIRSIEDMGIMPAGRAKLLREKIKSELGLDG